MASPRVIPKLHVARRVCGGLMLLAILFQFLMVFDFMPSPQNYKIADCLVLGIAGIGNWLLAEVQRRYSPPDFEG